MPTKSRAYEYVIAGLDLCQDMRDELPPTLHSMSINQLRLSGLLYSLTETLNAMREVLESQDEEGTPQA